MRGPHMGGGGFPLLGMVGFFVGLLITALLVYVLIRLLQKKNVVPQRFDQPPVPASPPSNNPLTVLDERLARGDIDVEDYRARREALLDGGLTRGNPLEPEPPNPAGGPKPKA